MKISFIDIKGNKYIENAFKEINVFNKKGKLINIIKRKK